MMRTSAVFNGMAALAACSMLVPNWARAEIAAAGSRPAPAAAAVLDVALAEGGCLSGQIVTSEGVPVRGEPIAMVRGGQEVARTHSDDQGRYEFRGLRGGVYQIVTEQGQTACRLWTGDAAPPSAQPGALIVVGHTVRGDILRPNWGRLIGLTIVAASGVGWWLSQQDDKKPSSRVSQ